MPFPAAAADDDDRAAFGDGAEDDVDDSEEEEEEEVDDESDEEEEDEEEDEEVVQYGPLPKKAVVTRPAEDLNSSSPSTSTSSDPARNPNPNNNPANPTKQPSPSWNGPAAVVIQVSPISAAAPAATATDDDLATPSPDLKRQKTEPAETASEEKKPLALLEDSRRLFQRLWTDEDEITILQGYLEFTSQRSAATAHHTHHHDTGPFYDLIKTRLQLEFNKNQLVEKLRRLKKKYRNVMIKMGSGKDYAFKSPHDQATFELSRKIWSNSIYSRAVDDDEEDEANHPRINHGNDHGMNSGSRTPRMRRRGRKRSVAEAAMLSPEAPVEVKVAESHIPTAMVSVPNVIEETVRSCLSPLFKELLHCAVGGPVGPGLGSGGGGLGLSQLPLTIGGNSVNLTSSGTAAAVDAKWRKQQILELEVYSKRIELVQEQIKLMLEELRSMG